MSVWERQIGLSDCAVYNIHLWDCVCDGLNIKYVRYCTVASNIQICVYVAEKVSNTSKSNALLWHSQFLAQIMQASYCRLWVVTCSAAAWKTEGVYFVPAATPKVFFGWGKMACCLITAQALKHWKPRPLLISPKMVYYWLVWLKKKNVALVDQTCFELWESFFPEQRNILVCQWLFHNTFQHKYLLSLKRKYTHKKTHFLNWMLF